MKTKTIVVSLLIALAAAGGGWWLAQPEAVHQHVLEKRTTSQGKTYYTCAMHPEVRQGEPGNCPICGMKLIARSSDASMSAPRDAVVEIDPRMAQNLGMRTAPATRGTFWQRIDAVGSVVLDERRIVTVESRTAGWIERLDVRAEGEPVQKGQRLATLYSPELFAAKQELKLARDSGDAALTAASQQRLRLLGGGAGGGSQSVIVAPTSGFVMELMAREGAQLGPGMPLMKLADLSQVWLLVEIPEAQISWVQQGRPAEARLKSMPGKVFEGRVDYLYPALDASTRTLKARLVFDNPDGALRPGLFADVTLFGGPQREVLRVPSEAVIRTGSRTVVMVAEGVGRYRPVQVETGPERNDETVILSGLEAGQQVVVSGQFLIDSEASLRGMYQRLGGAQP